MDIPPILEIGGILISSEIITEYFCCDYEKCKGICCVEGSDGAPVTMDEIAGIEDALDTVWPMLSASAQSVIDKQGVAYADRDGDMVTSIVRGKDCVFTCYDGDNCLCALEKAAREKAAANNSQFSILNSQFVKPISCALYPIREKNFGNGLIGLNYHRWAVCKDAVEKGKALGLPVYQFLKEPLIRRFGETWYQELCEVAEQLTANSQ
ncbi:MAG: DUF3109 family protein [Prevotella sp.]|nr:DUF3109 family protein [Prevotella sp.]